MKDNRNIVRAPRIHGRMVTDEDEIEQLLSPAQGEKLLESGALTGDWEFEGDGQEENVEAPGELKELRDALEESAKARDSIFQRNTQLSEANADLIKSNAGVFKDLRSAQIEVDNAEAKIAELTAQVETLKADLEKAQKPKTPAK